MARTKKDLMDTQNWPASHPNMANNDPKSTKCTQINKQQEKKNNKLHEINFAFEFQLFSFTSVLSLFGVFGVYKFRRSFCSVFVRSCCLFSFFLLLFFVFSSMSTFCSFVCYVCCCLLYAYFYMHTVSMYFFCFSFLSWLVLAILFHFIVRFAHLKYTHAHIYIFTWSIYWYLLKYSHSLGTV